MTYSSTAGVGDEGGPALRVREGRADGAGGVGRTEMVKERLTEGRPEGRLFKCLARVWIRSSTASVFARKSKYANEHIAGDTLWFYIRWGRHAGDRRAADRSLTRHDRSTGTRRLSRATGAAAGTTAGTWRLG